MNGKEENVPDIAKVLRTLISANLKVFNLIIKVYIDIKNIMMKMGVLDNSKTSLDSAVREITFA